MQTLDGAFATIICKSCWAEKFKELLQDAHQWLLYTNGETCIVILLSFTEKPVELRPETAASSLNPDAEPTIPLTQYNRHEESLLHSINDNKDLNNLA